MGRADAKARATIRAEKHNRIADISSQKYTLQQNRDHLKAEIVNLLYELKKRDYPFIQPVKVEYGPFTITRGGWRIASEVRGGRNGEYITSVYLLANGSIIRNRTRESIRYFGYNLISDVLNGVQRLQSELQE